MTVDIKPFNELWCINVVIKKSGNRYSYNTLLYTEPTENQVRDLWETQRKNWSKC